MRKTANGNGNGHDSHNPLVRQIGKKTAQPAAPPHALKESCVTFKTADGVELHGTPVRVTRHMAVFELYNPNVTLQFSEALDGFEITLQAQKVYSGRATIRNVVNAGTKSICEATLKEADWTDVNFVTQQNGQMADEFKFFLKEWQRLYKVSPEFKVVIADLQIFFQNLRAWLERVELKAHAFANPLRAQLEREAADDLAKPIIEAIDLFINKFESIVSHLEPDAHPGHYAYFRRQLHPLVLTSPFAHRAFNKPLGYAGDYEMVNMMIRSPYEGDTLFAKIINIWLLKQSPAQAHRNRVAHLTTKLIEETVRVRNEGRPAAIFNLGCGPAQEVQRFLEEQHIYECADFTLVDFNEETLGQLKKYLTDISRRLPRPATFRMIKKSVFHILKSGDISLLHPSGEKYDYIYCAGLFDYLSDDVCKQMMNIFYGMLAPGGLLLATNATEVLNSSRPFRFSMEYILDWHLVYRDQQQFFNLKPDIADDDDVKVIAENTGTNLFLEVRKPKNV
jgi:extracellular factor (EF) 3-hydroxypalmitic acid methyl ester biosynthesis protein